MSIRKHLTALLRRRPRSHTVGARLAAYVLVFALIVSLLLTGWQLWQTQQNELERVHQLIDQMIAGSRTHLADVVWEEDSQRAKQIAENILKVTDVSYVIVRSDDSVLAEVGYQTPQMIKRTVPLNLRHGEPTTRPFGEFSLGVDMVPIEARLRASLVGILVRSTLLTFLNVGFVLLLFQFMVTRHLSHISRFFSNLTPQTLEHPLQLDRTPPPPSGGDEFDALVRGVNQMQATLARDIQRRDQAEAEVRKLNDILERRVQERTRELLDKNQQLEQLSVTDSLTGLYNRLKLDQVLEEELGRSRRYGSRFAVLLLDIDHFKAINDHFGHPIGDQVLIAIARLLRNWTRDVDVVGRWGGEEFLVICRDTEFNGAVALAEKLRQTIATQKLPVVGYKTASFGVTGNRSGDTIAQMLARADGALYRSKALGRNRVESAA